MAASAKHLQQLVTFVQQGLARRGLTISVPKSETMVLDASAPMNPYFHGGSEFKNMGSPPTAPDFVWPLVTAFIRDLAISPAEPTFAADSAAKEPSACRRSSARRRKRTKKRHKYVQRTRALYSACISCVLEVAQLRPVM